MQYPNIFALVKELGIPDPFTPFTTSGFWTRDGLSVSAPVFSKEQQFPALLGQFIHTSPLFRCATAAAGLWQCGLVARRCCVAAGMPVALTCLGK